MAASRAGFAEKRAGKPPLPEGRSGYLPSAPHVPFAVLPLRVLQISLSGLFHSSGLLTVDPVDCLFPSYRGLCGGSNHSPAGRRSASLLRASPHFPVQPFVHPLPGRPAGLALPGLRQRTAIPRFRVAVHSPGQRYPQLHASRWHGAQCPDHPGTVQSLKKSGRMDAAIPLPGRAAVLNRGDRPHAVPAFPFRRGTLSGGLLPDRFPDNRGQHPVADIRSPNQQDAAGTGLQAGRQTSVNGLSGYGAGFRAPSCCSFGRILSRASMLLSR